MSNLDARKYACKDSIWEREEDISQDELASGVRFCYRLHSGRGYITGIQEWVITDWDRKHHEPGWGWITDLLKNDVITVPSRIDEFPVYSISISPFVGFQKLIVSEGIVEIGNYFGTISVGVWDDDVLPCRLNEVVLPNSLRFIREGTFTDWMLEKLVMPEGCAIIGDDEETL